MPIVTLASPKGGVGKTTAALLLAMTFAGRKQDVAVLDCDPNQPLAEWGSAERKEPAIVADVTPDKLLAVLDAEAARRDLVIVDLEGTATNATTYAISRSDLVIVPMGASSLDAAQAARAVRLVMREEEALGRSIACRVLFTRTSQIATKAERQLQRDLVSAGVAMLKTSVVLRVAFETMFAERKTLRELAPEKVNGLAGAIGNAEMLADEIARVLAASVGSAAA